MATTWAGTADNQLVTYAALLDGISTGILTAGSALSSSSRIATKQVVIDSVSMRTDNVAWNALASNECPTKAEIRNAARYSLWIASSKNASVSANYWVMIYRAGFNIGLDGVTSTSCTFKPTTGPYLLNYNDEIGIYCSNNGDTNKGAGTLIQFKLSFNTGTCGDGTAVCSADPIVMNRQRTYYVQPTNSGSSYILCN